MSESTGAKDALAACPIAVGPPSRWIGDRIRQRLMSVAALCLLTMATGCSAPDSAATAASNASSSSASHSASASADTPPASPTGTPEPGLSLVAIGDSIPYNSNEDCRAIIVGIAHNSILLNADAACGTTWDESSSTWKDWTKITPECSKSWAAKYRPQYDELFATIASWRKGKPTILRSIDKYSDWIGWEDAQLTPDQVWRTVFVHDDWNKMLCASAESHGFTCADIYHAFNGPRGTKPSGDLLGADYTHPSEEGNQRIARILIAQGFNPLA
jgi:lysophospholipase L1-like esterase